MVVSLVCKALLQDTALHHETLKGTNMADCEAGHSLKLSVPKNIAITEKLLRFQIASLAKSQVLLQKSQTIARTSQKRSQKRSQQFFRAWKKSLRSPFSNRSVFGMLSSEAISNNFVWMISSQSGHNDVCRFEGFCWAVCLPEIAPAQETPSSPRVVLKSFRVVLNSFTGLQLLPSVHLGP